MNHAEMRPTNSTWLWRKSHKNLQPRDTLDCRNDPLVLNFQTNYSNTFCVLHFSLRPTNNKKFPETHRWVLKIDYLAIRIWKSTRLPHYRYAQTYETRQSTINSLKIRLPDYNLKFHDRWRSERDCAKYCRIFPRSWSPRKRLFTRIRQKLLILFKWSVIWG